MDIHLKIIGVLLIALALLHGIFPRYFDWKNDLKSLSLINREMMLVHTFFIALTVFLMGILCLTSASDLQQTPLGKKLSLGIGIFWTIRFVIQLWGYSAILWKQKTFETIVHVVFSFFWLYMSIVFFIAAFQ